MKSVLFGLVGSVVFSLVAGFASSEQVELRNPDGQLVRPPGDRAAKATVFVFVRADCPISNRYAPEIRRIAGKYRPRGVNFWLVYPGRKVSPADIRAHLREYSYTLPALRDPEQKLVKLTGVQVTPEVAVFAGAGDQAKLVYHGRIDDRVADFGKTRQTASRHDLEEALDSILNGEKVVTAVTPAIGCFIADLE
ncbi:MAG: redoxin domain-containing protein [Acidobacteriota bacterium]